MQPPGTKQQREVHEYFWKTTCDPGRVLPPQSLWKWASLPSHNWTQASIIDIPTAQWVMNDGPAQYALVANKPLHFPKVEVIWVVRHMHARVQSPTCPFWSCLLPKSLIDHSPCSIAKLMRLRNFPTCFEPTSFLKIVRYPPLTPSVVTPSKHDCIHPAKAVFNTSPRFGSAPHLTDRSNNLFHYV